MTTPKSLPLINAYICTYHSLSKGYVVDKGRNNGRHPQYHNNGYQHLFVFANILYILQMSFKCVSLYRLINTLIISTVTFPIKSISPSSANPSMRTNRPAKKSNVPHSTLWRTDSSSCISANRSKTKAPNMAIQPVMIIAYRPWYK